MDMTQLGQKQNISRTSGTPGLWPAGECPFVVETIRDHHMSRVYSLCSVPAHHWVGIDDLEFIAHDPLTSDEMAQCIFQLTGGSGQSRSSFGQTAHFHVYYDEQQPGHLRLEVKPNCQHDLSQGNPFSITPDTGYPSANTVAPGVLL